MRLNERSGGVPHELLGQVQARGEPMVARVDEILGNDSIKVSLLVGTLGFKANDSVVVKSGQGVSGKRSLATAISGTEKVAMLTPGDVIAFDNAYRFNGTVFGEAVSARTDDMMRGKVQVVTAMARPSQSKVSQKGASQSLVIADGRNARTARSIDKVKSYFGWVASQDWPGGAPGIIFRGSGGRVIKEFFQEGRSTLESLLEDLEHEEVFQADETTIVEMIPAWRLPMGRDQVVRDLGDPRQETPLQSGPFTRKFISKETRGYPGFMPCLIVLSKEDVWEFGANTGRQMMMASGVQPLDKKEPVARDRLATGVRPALGTPAPINRLYDDETMVAMAKERLVRCPEAAPQQTATPQGRGLGRGLNGGGLSGGGLNRPRQMFGKRVEKTQDEERATASVPHQPRGRFSR